jgi:hypothetical protein
LLLPNGIVKVVVVVAEYAALYTVGGVTAEELSVVVALPNLFFDVTANV